MNINLKPELENIIQNQILSGKYDSINQVIEEALKLLQKRNQYDHWVEEIGQKIDLAAEEIDQGKGIEGETAIARIREKLQSQ